jgi:hypothetical protein
MCGKKPQQAKQQADVMPGAAQHGMPCITQLTLERIAIKPAIALHVAERVPVIPLRSWRTGYTVPALGRDFEPFVRAGESTACSLQFGARLNILLAATTHSADCIRHARTNHVHTTFPI